MITLLKPKTIQGFTLVELLISISIIGLITAIVVFNQSDFSDRLSLSNTVSEIDVLIREAQVYGVSVREFAPATSEFNVAYGVSFNFNNTGSSNSSFLSFADRNPRNGYYDTPTTCVVGSASECLGRSNLLRGNTITSICVIQSNNATQCAPTVGRFDVTFLRPNPDARFAFFNNSGNQISYPNHKGAQVEITSPKGKKQYIFIYTTGQISVQ